MILLCRYILMFAFVNYVMSNNEEITSEGMNHTQGIEVTTDPSNIRSTNNSKKTSDPNRFIELEQQSEMEKAIELFRLPVIKANDLNIKINNKEYPINLGVKNPTNNLNKNNSNSKTFLEYIQNDIKVEGIQQLNLMAKKIKVAVEIRHNISEIVENVTRDYEDELEKYFNSVKDRKVVFENELDWEYFFLDIIESCHRIFVSETKILYDNIMFAVSIDMYAEVDFLSLRQEIQRIIDDTKKKSYEYVCHQLRYCRSYPSYMDNLAELMNHILLLDDNKLKIIQDMFGKFLKENSKFFKSLVDVDTTTIIINRLTSLPDIHEFKDLLTLSKNLITDRYVLQMNNNKVAQKRVKALRILLDVIDKSFEKTGNDYYEYVLAKVAKKITHWDVKKIVEAVKYTEYNFRNMFNILDLHLFSETKEEIKVLMAYVVTGTTKNNYLLKELLTKGSNLIRSDARLAIADTINLIP